MSSKVEMSFEHEAIATSKQKFLFTSAFKSFHAEGVFCKISNPAINGANLQSNFQRTIKNRFALARKNGIQHPIIFGAIPFDVNQPSCLYIPENYQIIDRTQINPLAQIKVQPALTIKSAKSIPAENRFKQAVEQAKANFALSDIRKAVLSRIVELELHEAIDVEQIFSQLMMQNPGAYHFRLPIEDDFELIGASPELLMRKQGRDIFSNPLAGSAKRHRSVKLDRSIGQTLLNSSKDNYEHRLVIDSMREVLAPFCQNLTISQTPELINTSVMWHLSSTLRARLKNSSLSALQLACLLHPTPAVCGSPTSDARKLINLVEPFERGLFSGMVGWCNDQGDGEWVVTIRCGAIKQNAIRLFAGAGIVSDSDPDAEWNETQAKFTTMLNALGIEQSND